MQGISINRVEAKLDAHTAYTDQRFQAVDQQMSELNQQLAVTTAVNNERQNANQFLTGQMMSSINSTQQSVVTAAAKSSNSSPSYFGAMMIPFIVVPLALLALGSLAMIGKSNTQVIEYKNVPANGHPRQVPKEMYDRL
jgi:cytochrome c-type biogenesis protein CcmH/NrfG